MDSYLKNDSIDIDNTNPMCQHNFPISEIPSLGLVLSEINSFCISESLGGSEEDLGKDVFKFQEELEIIHDLIPSYYDIVKRDTLYVFNGVGCNMDIKSYKDSYVNTFSHNVVDLKGVICGGLGKTFLRLKLEVLGILK